MTDIFAQPLAATQSMVMDDASSTRPDMVGRAVDAMRHFGLDAGVREPGIRSVLASWAHYSQLTTSEVEQVVHTLLADPEAAPQAETRRPTIPVADDLRLADIMASTLRDALDRDGITDLIEVCEDLVESHRIVSFAIAARQTGGNPGDLGELADQINPDYAEQILTDEQLSGEGKRYALKVLALVADSHFHGHIPAELVQLYCAGWVQGSVETAQVMRYAHVIERHAEAATDK